jgi:hypothetical protein
VDGPSAGHRPVADPAQRDPLSVTRSADRNLIR